MSTATTSNVVDNTIDDPQHRPPLILGNMSTGQITDAVCRVAVWKTPKAWYIAFAASLSVLGMLGCMVAYLFYNGVGVWGLNSPVGWACDISNFVFWVGIGHAGTQ